MVAQHHETSLGGRLADYAEKYAWVFWSIIALLIATPILFGPWSLVKVNGGGMAPLLTPGSHYIAKNWNAVCAGDPVLVTHPDGHSASRVVMALGGDTVTLMQNGYRVARVSQPMSAAWLEAARETMGDAITVPRDRIMLRRASPDAARTDEYEALFMAAPEAVKAVFTRSLNGDEGFLTRVPRPALRCTELQ